MASSARWFLLGAGTLATDLATKAIAVQRLRESAPVAVLPWLDFTLSYNTGISFSFLQFSGMAQRWPLVCLSAIVSSVLAVALWREQQGRTLLRAGLSLVLGGAVGNTIDRGLNGSIVDFVSVHAFGWYFAIFNVADAAISVGVALIVLEALLPQRAD